MLRRAAVWVLAALLVIGGAGCAPEYEEVPGELRGVWTTAADGYEGRYLTIEGTTVVFGVRRVQSLRHTVHEVREVGASHGRGFEIRCTAPGGREIGVHLILEQERGSFLYLRHRPKVVWTREEDHQ